LEDWYRAGIKKKVYPHMLRHYAVELLKAGVDVRAVSKALGHSSVTITERYYSRWCQGQQVRLDETLVAALGKME
jgi:site-specific recombinase XerD